MDNTMTQTSLKLTELVGQLYVSGNLVFTNEIE